MEYGAPFRVVAEAAGKFVVIPQGCKLKSIYCSTVGKTGLPVDPPPEPTVPVVNTLAPTFGPDGTSVTIVGSGFGTEPGTVRFGEVEATVESWSDTQIVVTAVMGDNASGASVPLTVTNPAGDSNTNFMFMFQNPVVAAPEITSVTPATGPDGTELTIVGTGFGAAQGGGWANVGAESAAAYISWSDTEIVIVAAQGAAPLDTPQTLQVQRDDAVQSAPFDGFTFTIGAAREGDDATQPHRSAAKKKESKAGKRTSRDMGKDDKREIERPAGQAFPAFDSGGGFMLTGVDHAGGKIIMGPTELHEGQLYPLEMQCPDGLCVEVNAACDITFLVVR